MNKTVFISSTYKDLAPHRRAIWGLLKKFDVAVRGMEQFGARREAPLVTCLTEMEQSDICIVVIAFRLGSTDTNTGKSITQLEYEKACELNKDVLIYLIDEENARVTDKSIDRGKQRERLEAFKRTLRERHTVETFVSAEDLSAKLERDLKRRLEEKVASEEDTASEFERAAKVIRRFLLAPKSCSGQELRLQVRAKGEPYPASRGICDSLNLAFGATVGVKVEIANPEGFSHQGLDELYFTARQAEDFLPIVEGRLIDIYAKLQFADRPVDGVRARFKEETHAVIDIHSSSHAHGVGRVRYDADAKIALLLSKTGP